VIGRSFIKKEILTAVAMFIWKFDVEILEFVTFNRRKSNRGLGLDRTRTKAKAILLDRDIMVRLERRL
jgi:hypothetical protein